LVVQPSPKLRLDLLDTACKLHRPGGEKPEKAIERSGRRGFPATGSGGGDVGERRSEPTGASGRGVEEDPAVAPRARSLGSSSR